MSQTTEAFSRVKIDALLKDAGWNLTDGVSVLFEHALADGSRAGYAPCDRSGRPVAAVEAKRASINPVEAQDQGRHYAELLGVPFVFLSNGEDVWFLDREADAHARKIATFYSQGDVERRVAARRNRLELTSVEIDRRIVDRDYQIACIKALSAEVSHGRRKLLVEMHVPPSPAAVRDAMPALFDLLREEPEPAVRVVLGHFLFVHVHPYPAGNGRIGRVLVNLMLTAGGYPWTVIPVERRDTYMAALEDASVRQDIGPFTDFLVGLVGEGTEPGDDAG